MQKIQSCTYEKFLYRATGAHKDHLKVEFCDQVAIDMQANLFEDTFISTCATIRNLLPESCFSTSTTKVMQNPFLDSPKKA